VVKLSRERLIEIDVLSQRYGCLPSELTKLSLDDYQFTLLVAEKALDEESKQAKKAASKRSR
jgi:hypothetical protein